MNKLHCSIVLCTLRHYASYPTLLSDHETFLLTTPPYLKTYLLEYHYLYLYHFYFNLSYFSLHPYYNVDERISVCDRIDCLIKIEI